MMNLPKDLDKYILLYLYDELNDDERHEFEAHIKYSEESRKKLEEMRAFHALLGKKNVFEPSDALLSNSRVRLRERLREERRILLKESWWERISNYIDLRSRVFQLAGAMALFLLGIFIGRFALSAGGSGQGLNRNFAIGHSSEEILPHISNVDLIQYDPKSGNVTVHYKTVQDVALQGRVDDASIRRVLSYAIRTEDHPGRRLTAVKASGGSIFSDDDLEEALIHAMEKDEIDGIRLRAVKVLRRLPINQKIKNAFIRVLLKDSNPAIRIEALDALSTVKEEDVVPVFKNASQDDENEFVRLKASKALERTENPDVDSSNKD